MGHDKITIEALSELGFVQGKRMHFPQPLNRFWINEILPGHWMVFTGQWSVKNVSNMYEVKAFYNKVAGFDIEERHEHLNQTPS